MTTPPPEGPQPAASGETPRRAAGGDGPRRAAGGDGPRRAAGGDGPRRVRVTSPRAGAARRQAARGGTREIDEQTQVGDLYMRSLMHSQLRLALKFIVATGVFLGALPLLFALVPASRTLSVLGIPLPWLLLGVVVYPIVYVAARIYVRQAERIEAEFTEFVGRR